MKTSFSKGIFAEQEAFNILKEKNFKIIETRLKNKFGEIDILANKNKDYYIIEVKYRKNKEDLAYSISKKQIKRCCDCFFDYVQKNEITYENIFFMAFFIFRNSYEMMIINELE